MFHSHNSFRNHCGPRGDRHGFGSFSRHRDGRYPFAWLSVPVDIEEEGDAYVLRAYAPGRNKAGFVVTFAEDVLTIAHKNEAQEKTEESYRQQMHKSVQQESRQQNFERRFALNGKVRSEEITARYEDGVLIVRLPKDEEAQKPGQRIEVA